MSEEIPEEGEVRIIQCDGYVMLARVYPYDGQYTGSHPLYDYKYYGIAECDSVGATLESIRDALEKPPILDNEIYI